MAVTFISAVILIISPLVLSAHNSTAEIWENLDCHLPPITCARPEAWNLSVITPSFEPVPFISGLKQYTVYGDDQSQLYQIARHINPASKKKVAFIVHGFRNTISEPWMRDVAQAILGVDRDYLVVLVGWGNGADLSVTCDYTQAANNTRTVAEPLAGLARNLKNLGVTYTYCIGHSLGAHVCGIAGKIFKFDRITGLDPAGPSFEKCPLNPGLSQISAICVDNIHTNAAELGNWNPLGHVDFYVDCGANQPQCSSPICSHGKAVEYFIDSINGTENIADQYHMGFKGLRYPAGLGPCNPEMYLNRANDHLHRCQPCERYPNGKCDVHVPEKTCKVQPGCLSKRNSFMGYAQPIGWGSACYDPKTGPLCVRYYPSTITTPLGFFGVWHVPMCKDGFMNVACAKK